MQPDDELCLCFHVTRRKVANYLRIEKPRRVAQLSDCYGAGTGCGWCRPYLEKMFLAAQQAQTNADTLRSSPAKGDEVQLDMVGEAELPAADDYARRRGQYIREGSGTPPPGATPLAPPDSP